MLGFPKRYPVRVFKNTGTAGQISGRVWTRPSPTMMIEAMNGALDVNKGYLSSGMFHNDLTKCLLFNKDDKLAPHGLRLATHKYDFS